MLMYNKDRIFAFVNALGDVGRMGRRGGRLRQLGLPHPGRHRHSRNPAHRYLHLRARGGQRAHDEMVQKSVEVAA
jgi:hypothetical protein